MKCFDLRRLTSAVTPSEEFYEFHQTQTVRADAGAWRLRISGHVKRPAEFSLRDLMNRTDSARPGGHDRVLGQYAATPES